MEKGTTKACYLCGKTDFRKRPGSVRDNPSLDVLECTNCGLVFLSSFSHISNDYYELSQMHEAGSDVRSWLRETATDDARRFWFLKRLIENKSVLDFGCGNGGFLLLARETASEVTGIEVERRLAGHFEESGLPVFESLGQTDGAFDVITLFHVLEHMPDPINLLRALKEKVNAGGSIIIEVPSADDALLSVYQNKAFSEFTYWSCHLFLLTQSTLSAIILRAGLEIDFIKQVQRYPLSNHLHWLAKGEKGGHQKWTFMDSEELNAAYEKQLASIGRCDTLIAKASVPV